MTEAGHVWIGTEQALLANNTPDGVLGLQLVHANSDKEHIRVSSYENSTVSLSVFVFFFSVFLCFVCLVCAPPDPYGLAGCGVMYRCDVGISLSSKHTSHSTKYILLIHKCGTYISKASHEWSINK